MNNLRAVFLYPGPRDMAQEFYGKVYPPDVERFWNHPRPRRMKQPIVGYHQDDEGHWVAELRCGHAQHVRHDPPWQVREWVTTPEGRASRLGVELECIRCDEPAVE